MICNYSFASDKNWRNDFLEVYSLVSETRDSFIQEESAIKNSYNEERQNYNYISIAHNRRFTAGARAMLTCSFEKYGAPLITLANSVEKDERGFLIYGDHYEIVAYEGGCNVWFITKSSDGSQKPYINQNLLRLRFSIENGMKIDLSVAVGAKQGFITVDICGNSFDLPVPNLSDSFIIGFTACEGINRLYEAVIEQ